MVISRARVIVWDVSLRGAKQRFRRALSVLSSAERARARRFYRPEDAWRWVLARYRLRQILGYHLGCQPGAIAFAEAPGKKPVLKRPRRPLHFNLSHAGGRALVAVSGRPVGVDLEPVRTLRAAAAVVERNFAGSEADAWRRAPKSFQDKCFFHGWTRKEALVKATGDGLAVALDRVEVSLDDVRRPRVYGYPGRPAKNPGLWLFNLELGRDYVGALAVDGPLPVWLLCRRLASCPIR